MPYFHLGIPTHWVDEWEVAYYNGKAIDVNGNAIPYKCDDGPFHDTRPGILPLAPITSCCPASARV